MKQRKTYIFYKSILDILLSLLLTILLLPVIIVTAFVVYINIGRPFFFSQSRVGYKNKIFVIFKFRTMNQKTDFNGQLLPDHQRCNFVGQWIRKLSLDELPQLWNVIKGDMSLIGPRPLPEVYLPLYNKEQLKRHNIKPGITGWAQVNGRNAIEWNTKFQLDIYYVKNVSLLLDTKIFFLTIKKVLFLENVNQSSEITMAPFRGNDL